MAAKKPQIVVTTPAGRMVGGSFHRYSDTDLQGAPCDPRWWVDIAIPFDQFVSWYNQKVIPALKVWGTLENAGYDSIEEYLEQLKKGAKRAGLFLKLTHGDSTMANAKGNKPCDKPGYAGNIVLTASTKFLREGYQAQYCVDKYHRPIKPGQVMESGQLDRGEMPKPGDTIQLSVKMAPNGSTESPGIFVHLVAGKLVESGEPLFGDINADEAFGEPKPLPDFGETPSQEIQPAGLSSVGEKRYKLDGVIYTQAALEAAGIDPTDCEPA